MMLFENFRDIGVASAGPKSPKTPQISAAHVDPNGEESSERANAPAARHGEARKNQNRQHLELVAAAIDMLHMLHMLHMLP